MLRLVFGFCLVWFGSTRAAASAFEGRFQGVKGAEIGYRIYENDEARGAILLLNGYSETYLMYDELATQLVTSGYRVYTYDFRGQGVSDRLLPAIDVGYVADFQDYVDDLATFLETIVRPREPLPLNLLAHSTGGLIAVHYAADHPAAFRRMALSAPYFEINAGILPSGMVKLLAAAFCAFGRCEHFALSQGGFEPETFPFERNTLTHSRRNFDLMKAEIWGNPALLIRGASNGFLLETMRAGEAVAALAPKVTAPVLLFQAEDDQYVRPARQDDFCAKTHCEKVVLPGAFHELLFEEEPTRTVVLEKVLSFFATP